MNRMSCCLLAAFAVAASTAGAAHAGDTLLIERVREAPANLPARGMHMSQVEARYGAPVDRLDPRGGQKRAWPVIRRWAYPTFTVYFERDRVIDAVVNRSGADEIGPKPALR